MNFNKTIEKTLKKEINRLLILIYDLNTTKEFDAALTLKEKDLLFFYENVILEFNKLILRENKHPYLFKNIKLQFPLSEQSCDSNDKYSSVEIKIDKDLEFFIFNYLYYADWIETILIENKHYSNKKKLKKNICLSNIDNEHLLFSKIQGGNWECITFYFISISIISIPLIFLILFLL